MDVTTNNVRPGAPPPVGKSLQALKAAQDMQSGLCMCYCMACLQLAKDCCQLAMEIKMKATAGAAVATLAVGDTKQLAGIESAPGHAEYDTEEKKEGADTAPELMQAAPSMQEEVVQAAGVPQVQQHSVASQLQLAAQMIFKTADEQSSQYLEDARQLYQHISRRLDAATANMLLFADEHVDDKGDVLLTTQQEQLQWGLWLNTHKNPRFKLIDFGGLGVTVEVPKQIALANVAIRLQRLPYNQHSCGIGSGSGSGNGSGSDTKAHLAAACLAPLGGILQLELLAVPPPAKHSRGWTIHQVNNQTTSLMVLPYPIPPAGADLNTWQPDEEPPPFIISMRLSSQLLVPAALHVGWWDQQHSRWSEEGISNVKYNSTSGWLTFSTLHLGDLALLQDTTAMLPYSSWSIRPAGGLGGACAIITLQVAAAAGGSDDQQLMLEVGKGTALLRSPQLPQLSHITNRALPLWQLFTLCEEAGLRLLPGPAEARALGLHEKKEAMEGAMCADLAQLCGAFLVASSRWNRVAGADAILVRLSEVTDWEEGGRIEPQHVARIFAKEKAAGPYGKPVFVLYRQGLKGVMLVDGGDNRPTSPPLPDFSTAEGIQAASRGKFCQLHADLQHLLDGTDAQLSEELLEQCLSATAEGLELVRAADPVFSYTMQQAMQALRLLTFG